MATSKARKVKPAVRPKALTKTTRDEIDDVDAVDKIDWSKARFIGRGLHAGKRRIVLSLSQLREASGRTQLELSKLSGFAQGEISKIEHRDDMLLSTLRRFARALGAEIELTAVFPTGHRIGIDVDPMK